MFYASEIRSNLNAFIPHDVVQWLPYCDLLDLPVSRLVFPSLQVSDAG